MSVQVEYEGPSFVFTLFKNVKDKTKERLGETGWRDLIYDLSEVFALNGFQRVSYDMLEKHERIILEAPIERIIRVLPPLKEVADDYELAFVLEKKLKTRLRTRRKKLPGELKELIK